MVKKEIVSQVKFSFMACFTTPSSLILYSDTVVKLMNSPSITRYHIALTYRASYIFLEEVHASVSIYDLAQ